MRMEIMKIELVEDKDGFYMGLYELKGGKWRCVGGGIASGGFLIGVNGVKRIAERKGCLCLMDKYKDHVKLKIIGREDNIEIIERILLMPSLGGWDDMITGWINTIARCDELCERTPRISDEKCRKCWYFVPRDRGVLWTLEELLPDS